MELERKDWKGLCVCRGADTEHREESKIFSPVASQRSGQGPATQAPLWQAVGMEGPVYEHVLFCTVELLNRGLISRKPRKGSLMKTVIRSHNPNWGDMQALLDALLTAEEKPMALEGARKEKERRGTPASNDVTLPTKDVQDGDPNPAAGMKPLERYRNLILCGVIYGVPQQNNMPKVCDVMQGPNSTLSALYRQIWEVAGMGTDADLDDVGNTQLFNGWFMGHLAPDRNK